MTRMVVTAAMVLTWILWVETGDSGQRPAPRPTSASFVAIPWP